MEIGIPLAKLVRECSMDRCGDFPARINAGDARFDFEILGDGSFLYALRKTRSE
jgi:hypothetical protein